MIRQEEGKCISREYRRIVFFYNLKLNGPCFLSKVLFQITLNCLDESQIFIININNQMQNSVCKRIAKSFELQRYIPQYQVYELCINWQSELPIPPTIFYLSEIFIYPYNIHHLPHAIKNQLAATPNKIQADAETIIDHENSTIVQRHSKSQIGLKILEQETKSPNLRTLDYDKALSSKALMNEIKMRNKQIVKHQDFKAPFEARKKRKM